MMRLWFCFLLFLPAGEILLADQPKPNFILCMADDLGWGDTGYNGHRTIKTPCLDKMAKSGLRFNRFYAGSSVCSPTRGSCLTGRHPLRYSIRTANDGHLRKEEINLAEVLKSQGYATGHFGKWHLGTLSNEFSGKGKKRKPAENYMTPGMAGFDRWFSTEYAVATWDPYDPKNAHGTSDPRALYWENGQNIVDGVAAGLVGGDSRIIMDRALPFIEQSVADRKPFFAVIWFHAPHAPVVGGPRYRAMYPNQSLNQQHYFAAVTELDEQVGRLRDKLVELRVDQDTMFWFCSDNGPEGNPRAKARFQGSAGPFRGRKRSLYEGGVRVPGILQWPKMIGSPRTTDFPAVTSDYFPTIMDVLGNPVPRKDLRAFDGVSLLPLIEGKTKERQRPIAFEFGRQASLSGNRYKLVRNSGNKPRSDNGALATQEWELYDLVQDPGETANIADQFPEVVADMRSELQRWQKSCAASIRAKDDNAKDN